MRDHQESDVTLKVDEVPVLAAFTSGDGAGVSRAARPLGEPSSGVWEFSMEVRNTSGAPIEVRGLEALTGRLLGEGWTARYFRSEWGGEFEPESADLGEGFELSCVAGRSSQGVHPWLLLERPGQAVVISPAWSGNWRISVEPDGSLRAGIGPEQCTLELPAGDEVSAPVVYVALAADAEAASLRLTQAVGELIAPRSAASDSMPVEWNHWWPYEDAEITEQDFLDNTRVAAGLGIEVATLDAGWFGSSATGSDWQLERGDWHLVNGARFPSGLKKLSDEVRNDGLAFGIWIEAEAVGARAALRSARPEIMARRSDGNSWTAPWPTGLDPEDTGFLGYVCMGSPEGRAHVAAALDDAVVRTGARWVKLDFNIDPGPGCDRTDHGHGAGDGLFRHYQALYEVLDEFRSRHPEVILEGCSSGGLRIDLGLARHVHCMFLSDPDWTEHHLQVLWGASLMLPSSSILHWSWSQWRGEHKEQEADFGAISVDAFDTMVRAAMLHRLGFSLRLPELRDDLLGRLREHTAIFRDKLAPLVRSGRLRRLTGQPRRYGLGERRPVFQLSGESAHLLATYLLPGGEFSADFRWAADEGLDEQRRYRVTELGATVPERVCTGRELLDGLSGVEDDGKTSWLFLAEALDS